MDIATGPLSSLLPKLAKLLQDEYNLQRSARKGIEFLHKELEFMNGALHKVGQVPREQLEEPQRIWARDVRELSYDMEDIVDTFMVDVEGPDPPSKRGVKKIFKKMMRKVNKAMARPEVAQEINDIKERAKELAERRERYKVDDIAPAKKILVDPRLNAMYADATKIIVGIEEAKVEVLTMLTGGDDDQKKRIVSIAGFGGLGKTTLAKSVYDEIEVKFDCTAFVSVSRNVDTQKLLKDILYQLDKETFGDIHSKMLDERLLINEATEFLNNKRYLIVIDDIWDKEPWDKVIRFALIENNMRSRIITTTRNIAVAEHAGGCYRLKPLSDESSEKLFYGRIFGSKDKCPNRFSDVSKKILKKCGGVPLAIVTTSSMLANKSDNLIEWNKVFDSIGSGLGGNNSSMDDMREILLLSYYDLPSHLKTCLLYLSIFPEDHEISKDGLIWRWVAEGFIHDKKVVQGFLDIGESYFNELLNRSLVQPTRMDVEGTPKACRVHDTVLDLIVSLSVEERFITIISDDGKHSLESEQVRWLSMHNATTKWPAMKMPKLRSLTIFDQVEVIKLTPSPPHYLLLRVLDLGGCRYVDFESLRFIGSLSHLRYLGLSCYYVRGLPVEVGKLQFLQTLDVYEANVEELPSSITEARQLICLRGSRCEAATMLPDGLKNLTSLEVLEWANINSECVAEELGHLTQLRVLDVVVSLAKWQYDDEWRACTKALVGSLGALKKIESLHIRKNTRHTLSLDGSMEEPLSNLRRICIGAAWAVPAWIGPASLPGLSYLEIGVQNERREDIQVLAMLPCLRHLKFTVLAAPERGVLGRCPVGTDAFPCATRCEFDIYGNGGVVPCMFPRGSMPRLQDLTFRTGRKQFWRRGGGGSTIEELGLGHLPSIRSVTVLGLYGYGDDEARKDKVQSVREKLEHEAAVHPNHPLRIEFKQDDNKLWWSSPLPAARTSTTSRWWTVSRAHMDLKCLTAAGDPVWCRDPGCADGSHPGEAKVCTCRGNGDYQVVFCPCMISDCW
ncbi:unnamed protein product [Urochloa decumbens]|uniref:Uncharacterized protein n=1 Tax=Urochloa decumbens TaxID=240449 RepID=A0ABC8W8P8_9POAL